MYAHGPDPSRSADITYEQLDHLSALISGDINDRLSRMVTERLEVGDLSFHFKMNHVPICEVIEVYDEAVSFYKKSYNLRSVFDALDVDRYRERLFSDDVGCLAIIATKSTEQLNARGFFDPGTGTNVKQKNLDIVCNVLRYKYAVYVLDINFCIGYLTRELDQMLFGTSSNGPSTHTNVDDFSQSFCGRIDTVLHSLEHAHRELLRLESKDTPAIVTTEWVEAAQNSPPLILAPKATE